MYEFNLEKANQLLDEAGYKANSDGIRFSATLDYEPGLPEQQKLVAEYFKRTIKESWY